MKTILLTQGKVALVDDSDYEELSKYKWSAMKHRKAFYARRHARMSDGPHLWKSRTERTTIFMHQQLLNTQGTTTPVDHIDHDGLNNQRVNIRKCNNGQNQANKVKQKGKFSSKYKGVSRYRSKWMANITIDNKRLYLGLFENELDAAKAYNQAAITYHTDFACINPLSS